MNESKGLSIWPELLWSEWQATADTLHMYMQIVGKTRVSLTVVQNHWWNVPFYVTARGLSTSAMPVPGGGLLDIEFDFIDHLLIFRRDTGRIERLSLVPKTVAAFFADYKNVLEALRVPVHIDPLPVEMKVPVRFHEDTDHKAYDPDAVNRFWQVLAKTEVLLKRFCANFYGKVSPVHFFWGSLDLACTRFNGRRAPVRPGADDIQAEAYSHECISMGFWPGNGGYGQAAFYAYAAPVPSGLSESTISGPGSFNDDLGEFILNYADLRSSLDPDQTLLDFWASTYDAASTAAGWDRELLDRHDAIAALATHLDKPQKPGKI